MDDIDRDILAAPIRDQNDLYERWSILMGPLGFSRRSLWFTVVDADRRMVPSISQIEDLPDGPADVETISALMDILRRILDDGPGPASIAFLVTRPGRHAMTPDDRSWARALSATARLKRVPIEPVHLATDQALVAFAPDDLAA